MIRHQTGLSFRHGLALGALLTAALLAALVLSARADWYGTAALGQGKYFNSVEHDRAWEQRGDGYAARFDPATPVWSLGVGYRFSPRFAAELTGHQLGKYSQFGLWAYDDIETPRTCPPNCKPTQYGYSESRTKGAALSGLVYGRLGRAEPYLRLGMLRWHSTWHTYISCPAPYNSALTDYHAQIEYGWSPVVGLGLRVGAWSLEATRFSQIKPHDGAIQGINTFTLARRF